MDTYHLYFYQGYIQANIYQIQLVKDYFEKSKQIFDYNEKTIESKVDEQLVSIVDSAVGISDLQELRDSLELTIYDTMAKTKNMHLFVSIGLLASLWEQQIVKFIQHDLRDEFTQRIKITSYKFAENVIKCSKAKVFIEKDKITELMLLNNVIKHGEGRSATNLRKKRPDFFKEKFIDSDIDILDMNEGSVYSEPYSLKVTEDDFYSYADSLTAFWNEVPEHAEVNMTCFKKAVEKFKGKY
ncbi:hypothetical protein MOF37_21875 [Bacillus spizizenii]|nr:hypothetical protein [Bacillus spizizenii]MCY9427796.1 hypothetical protein [Bacillus spizizenii]MCY9431944.1 hypothetical protein [Bacillus spizizenii]